MRSTMPETGLRAAVHSYVHVSTRPKVKPYFKLPTARPSTGRQAQRAASDGGPWNVPDLCQACNWPTGLAGGGVIAIVELGGGWVPSDKGPVFHRHRSAGPPNHRRFG
jgi:hypothetical protein